MNELPTANPLEASGVTDRPAPYLPPEGGDWKTAQRDTTVPPQVTTEAGDRRVTTLWTAALGLCLRRYGAPQTATLTILTSAPHTGFTLSHQIDLALADTMRAAEWLAATSRVPRMNGVPVAGEEPAQEKPPIDGWRVALLLHSDLPPGDHAVFSDYDQVFAMRSLPGTARLSLRRKQTRHAGDWPVNQMITHWEQLAIGLMQLPEVPVGRLSILTLAETETLIRAYEKPREATRNPRFGFELFDDQVTLTPDAPAVTEGEATISYRELWERSNRLAHYLQKRGVGPETIVGIFLERSIDLVVAVIALQKAGGAYLPIDPAYPHGRLEYLISDSCVNLIITRAHLAKILPPGDYRAVQVDHEAAAIAAMDADTPVHGLKPGNMSFVFYTSGSTGEPKGVIMQHAVRAPFDRSKVEPENLAVGEKVLLKSAVGFTLILREIFWPLQWGGHLVVVPQGMDSDSSFLVRVLRDHNVVGANFVPSMLSLLVDEVDFEQCTSLRLIYTVGESLAVEVQRRLFARLPNVRLFVFYGCTEAPAATFRECRPDEPYGNRIVIGKPMANKKVYLLDRNLVPVPPGVAGEIHTGGSISRGYLHRPGLTADRFIPNPFSEQPGERMYRTGDLARRLPDGNLEFLGRADFQVQVRGVRVELGEIEAAIVAHPAVKESLVIADPRHPDQTRLLAYYTARDGRRPPVAELRNGLRRYLPEYMIPSSFTWLDAFPLNANGKVDRRNLPEPQAATAGSDQDAALPRTAEEVRLVGIWSRILGVDTLGVTDRFFDLGGDSILVTRMIAQINREFGSALSLPDFYRNPTIAGVTRRLFGKDAGSGLQLFLPISTSGNRRPIFMANTYPFLARYFGPDQPYYGMKHHWLDARFDYKRDVPTIARDFIREMRQIQPEGPYVIAGFSMGGLFALEMARQLEAAGQELDCLLLLDAVMPDTATDEAALESEPPGVAPSPAPTGRLTRHRARWRDLSIAEKFTFFWARRNVPANLFRKYCGTPLQVMLGRGFNALSLDVPFRLRRMVATHYYNRIRQAYRLQPLRSRAIVYLVQRHAAARTAQFNRLFPAGAEIRILATDHHLEVMKEPYLSQWITPLRQRLTGQTAAPTTEAASAASPLNGHAVDPAESSDLRQYRDVCNGEGQFSVWPMDWNLPTGWNDAGIHGVRESCLTHVKRIWTDQRPASLG